MWKHAALHLLSKGINCKLYKLLPGGPASNKLVTSPGLSLPTHFNGKARSLTSLLKKLVHMSRVLAFMASLIKNIFLLTLSACFWNLYFVTLICIWNNSILSSFSSVPLFSHVRLCNPTDCSMPGLPVHHQLPEFTRTHVHWVSDVIQPPHPLSSLLRLPSVLRASGSFPKSQLFSWGGQSTGVSISTSVLPMNIHDWFLLGWTGWISLQSKGLSRVFSNTIVQKFESFSTQLSL